MDAVPGRGRVLAQRWGVSRGSVVAGDRAVGSEAVKAAAGPGAPPGSPESGRGGARRFWKPDAPNMV